jgi:hypothetical protein
MLKVQEIIENLLPQYSTIVIGLPSTRYAKLKGTILHINSDERVNGVLSLYLSIEFSNGEFDIVPVNTLGFFKKGEPTQPFTIEGEPVHFESEEGTAIKYKFTELRNKINSLYKMAIADNITFEAAFSRISPTECIPDTEFISATWSIDDLRDRFPPNTSDAVLFTELQSISNGLHEAAVIAGNEIIDFYYSKYKDEEEN